MTIVNIKRDGSVYPPLNPDGLLVKILGGNLKIGKYEKETYLNGFNEYICEPDNALELKKELIKLINTYSPELFNKYYVVHVLCPAVISLKVRWAVESTC